MAPSLQKFSVTREDLAFSFAQTLGDIFSFSPFKDESPTGKDGIRHSAAEGYDFQLECTPTLKILAISDELVEPTGWSLKDLQVNIFVEDIGLAVRKPVFCIPASDLETGISKEIDLRSFDDLSFRRGFEIKCCLSPINSLSTPRGAIWHKSQVICQKIFIAKTVAEEALFEITWTEFGDEEERSNLLYFIDWISTEVSTLVDTECFQVKANAHLKEQFKRLENNSHFGGFCIRMIAEQILRELLHQTLKFAEINDDLEPQKDSLHYKFENLLQDYEPDFKEMAKMLQSPNKMEQANAVSEISKVFQKLNNVGSTLQSIKFGGYR